MTIVPSSQAVVVIRIIFVVILVMIILLLLLVVVLIIITIAQSAFVVMDRLIGGRASQFSVRGVPDTNFGTHLSIVDDSITSLTLTLTLIIVVVLADICHAVIESSHLEVEKFFVPT